MLHLVPAAVASGAPRYAVALSLGPLGTGLLRPFLLLYGALVLGPSAPVTGVVTAGVRAVRRWRRRCWCGCWAWQCCWSPRPARSGCSRSRRCSSGVGAGVARRARRTRGDGGRGRERDAALALRNAGLGAGGLPATVCPAAGATALHMLAAVTGVAYLVAAVLAWSVQVRADPADGDTGAQPAPRMAALPAANAVSVFCLNVPEVAIPLVLVPQVHASPVWSGPTFVINTVLVVTGQVPVTVLVSRFPGGGCQPSPGW